MDDDESESAVMKLPKVHSHMQRSAMMIKRQFLFLFSRFVKTEYSKRFMYSVRRISEITSYKRYVPQLKVVNP